MPNNLSIADEIYRGVSFIDEERQLIASAFTTVTVPKGKLLIKCGDFVDAVYFISKGCLRTFLLDNQGKEYTIQFGIDNFWISNFVAYLSGEKSTMNIEAIKDSTLYKVTKKDILNLYKRIPQLNYHIRERLEFASAHLQERILLGISKSSKDRYLQFIKTYPEIEKSIKNYHIASYLGITTESLSRIRKDLYKNDGA